MKRAPSIGLASWQLAVRGTSVLKLAQRMKASGVQMDLGGPGRGPWIDQPGNIAALRHSSIETGVALLAVAGNILNDIGLTTPPQSMAMLKAQTTLIRLLDTTAALGCPMAFVPSFRRSAIDTPGALRRTATILSWAAEEASARGLVLANENVLGVNEAKTLVEEVAAPNFRLIFDTYNPRTAGLDPAEILTGLAPHLADQVHLKDGFQDGGNTRLLGGGDGDVAATLEALARERVPVKFLVLENNYRSGDETRLSQDVRWTLRNTKRWT